MHPSGIKIQQMHVAVLVRFSHKCAYIYPLFYYTGFASKGLIAFTFRVAYAGDILILMFTIMCILNVNRS